MIKVINVISDTNIGGAGRVIVNFLKLYDKNKFNIKIMLPTNSKLIKEIEQLGVETIEIEGLADKSMDINAIHKIYKIFRYEQPDIVHTHASMSAKIAAKLCNIKTVYTRHTVAPQKKILTTFPGKQINGMINGLLSNKIIAVAKAAKQNLLDTGIKEEKIEIVLNGVEGLLEISDEKKKKTRRKYFIEDNEIVISMIARLDKAKGHEFFIKAAKIIVDRGMDIKFLIAGTGDIEIELKQLSKSLGIEKHIVFVGFQNDITDIMNITDIIANCSYGTEATNLALLEAMSIGKPSIVTNSGGNVDVVNNGINGIIIPMKDSNALAEAIVSIYENKELAQVFKENAIKIYKEKFNNNIMTKKIEEIYEKIIH